MTEDDLSPPPELAISAELLEAVFAEDHDRVTALRDLDGVSWWNVALSYAHLLKGISSGKPEALEVLSAVVEDARRTSDPES